MPRKPRVSEIYIPLVDFLKVEGEALKLVIRDQKTSRTMGSYTCPLPNLLKELLLIWMDRVRAPMANELKQENILWNLTTKKPFDQQLFSKHSTRAFKAVIGDDLNQQIIRRIFTSGVSL
jgi:hypothetical protein